jgi:hypothetical protein
VKWVYGVKRTLLCLLFLSVGFVSCKKDDDIVYVAQPDSPEVLTMRAEVKVINTRPELQIDDVQIQHLLISFKGSGIDGVPRSLDEAEQLTAQLWGKLKAGEDFDAMVKKYTNDQYPGLYNLTQRGAGDTANNIYRRGDMVASFGEVSFRLEVGEVGIALYHPEKSPFGYHLIKRLK